MFNKDNQNQTINNQKYPKVVVGSIAEASEDKYKRALADYQNLLKQTTKEKHEFIKYANKHLLHEILPVYDNLRMALKYARKHIKERQENAGAALKDANIYEGFEHIARQFKDVLKNVGIEEIKTIGEKFDHHTMEAIKGKGELVVKEVKAGYCLNGKVIVAARVVVG